MAVLHVTRKTPQNIASVKVAMGPGGSTAGELALLQASVAFVGYTVQSFVDPAYPGGWRIKFSRQGELDQFAYPDDVVVVTDALYDQTSGWALQPSSRVVVYGQSEGLIGTAADFDETFEEVTAT